MLSRTANALAWMARYMERAEATARLADVNLSLSLDLDQRQEQAWEAVVATTGDRDAFRQRYERSDRASALRFLVLDPEHPNSVANCVRLARENARTVRERLPGEAWELINGLYLRLGLDAPAAGQMAELLDLVKAAAGQLEGLLGAVLLRDEGWHVVQLGRYLERADQTTRLVDVQHALLEGTHEADPGHELRWEAVLRSVSGLTMYRRRHGVTEGRRVAQFLLLDAAFPRSAAFCLGAAETALRGLLGTAPGEFVNPAEKALGKLAAQLRYTELEDVLRDGIHQWLDRLQLELIAVGERIEAVYFEPGTGPAPEPTFEQPQQQ